MIVLREITKATRSAFKRRAMKLFNAGKTQDYKEAVEALNSLQTNAQLLQKLRANKALGQENNVIGTIKYLERSGVSLDQLDRGLSVIHVSGTKGKGSTCVICEAILRRMGYKTGFFSSPHLLAVRERIRINQTPLSEADFTKHFWAVYNKLSAAKDDENDMPSYFKFLTVMAVNVFLVEKVDVAIIEVGIGGEYDCTNVFRSPAVVGISSLGLDHTSLLGATVEEIAWQKGGIMKLGALAFTSPQPPCAVAVLRRRAVERQCPLWEVPPLTSYDWQGREVSVGLRGRVQLVNASLALQLAHAWVHRQQFDRSRTGLLGSAKAFSVSQPAAEGLKHCSWPGRYQILTRKSIHGTCTYYLDGAHTLESIELCAQWFHQATNNIVSRHVCHYTLVYNVTGDRDTADLLSPLVSCHFDSALFCPNVLACDIKASDLTNLMVTSRQQLDRCEENKKTWLSLERQNNVFATEVKTFASVAETLKHVESRPGEHHVLVTGSLHLIGTVLSALDPELNTFSAQNSRHVCHYTLVYNVTGDRDTADLLSPLVSCHFDSALFCPNVLACDIKASDLTNLMVTSRQQLDRCEENKKTWLSLERQNNVFATEVKTFASVAETLKHVESRPGEHHVLVTGSLHLIGTVLSALDPELNTFSAQNSR